MLATNCMYNLFVTAQEGAWEGRGYEYDRGRFLEYTTDKIASRFQDLKSRQLEALRKLPCLFAYEGEQPMRVGRLVTIKVRGRALFIEFVLDENIPEIPFEKIAPLRQLLDIRSWEMNRTHWAVKDEDLFERLRTEGLLPAEVAQPAMQDALPEPEPADRRADSVGNFIEAVLELNRDDAEVFYRGHSNKEYRLEPSVFRKDTDGNYLHLDEEDRIYRELIVSNSSDFIGDDCSLDRLVRMQHYSLPTRLLDITANPLIALYFACRSHKARQDGEHRIAETPGEVILFSIDRNDIKYFDSDTVSCLANLARLPRRQKDGIDYSLTGPAFNRQPTIKRLLHFVAEEKPFFESRIKRDDLRSVICVKSKRNNDRISFQLGAFLVFGHDAVLDELGTPQIGVKRIAIANKEKMLKELDQLNINERTVFPYIENSARYIAEKFRSKHPR